MKTALYTALFLVAGILVGCKTTVPSHVESTTMNRAKRLIFVGNRATKNPLPSNAENLAQGKEAFSHYCFACHGMDGQNTGVLFADRMSPPVPSLASADVQAYTDGQLKWIIDNGLFPSGMPSSRGILSDEEIWSIVIYLRHLPPAGALGDPPIYSGNCDQSQHDKSGGN
jgi:S-disulfanyl-L-cysteine oxidoreductase SoxD